MFPIYLRIFVFLCLILVSLSEAAAAQKNKPFRRHASVVPRTSGSTATSVPSSWPTYQPISSNHKPRLWITSIGRNPAVPGQVIPVLLSPNVIISARDLSPNDRVEVIVRPDGEEHYWGDEMDPASPNDEKWQGAVYFGRPGMDRYSTFTVYAVVVSKLLQNGSGVISDPSLIHRSDHVIARSKSLKVIRVGDVSDPYIDINELLSQILELDGRGTPGHAPLPVLSYGEARGSVYIPPALGNGSNLRVWLLAHPLSPSQKWVVIAGPVEIRSASWTMNFLQLPELVQNETVVCIAVLAKATVPWEIGDQFSELVRTKMSNPQITKSTQSDEDAAISLSPSRSLPRYQGVRATVELVRPAEIFASSQYVTITPRNLNEVP